MNTGALTILCLLAAGCGRVGYSLGEDGDAGSDGGGAADGSVAAGCGPSALFCDGFEAVTLVPPWQGTISDPGSTLARATTGARAGEAALEASVTRERTSAFVYAPLSPAPTDGSVYARAWFRFSSAALWHLDFLTFDSPDGAIGPLVLDGEIAAFNPLALGEIRSTAPLTVPLDTWVCVELHLGLDRTAGVIDVWLDDALALHADGMTTIGASPVGLVRVGVSFAGAGQGPATVWVDEVVVATERIGCH